VQLTLNVTTTGNPPVPVVVTPAAWIRWERRNKSKVSNMERDGIGMEDMAYLAYESLPGDGRPATFDEYVVTLVEISPGAPERPTSPAQ
jgi:hypothetical protein